VRSACLRARWRARRVRPWPIRADRPVPPRSPAPGPLAPSAASAPIAPTGATPRCMSDVLTTVLGTILPFGLAVGVRPRPTCRPPYNLPSSNPPAPVRRSPIVDAFRRPERRRATLADLPPSTLRALPACTSASGCFRKVNQTGGTLSPAPDTGWAQGDLARPGHGVSATCPNCHILLVETSTNLFSDPGGRAWTRARRAGAPPRSRTAYGGRRVVVGGQRSVPLQTIPASPSP